MALHFVGFRGDEYIAAIRVFGLPDFFHRNNDPRFRLGGELSIKDTVVFANGLERKETIYSFNDSEMF